MSRAIIAIAAVIGFIMLAWSFLQPRDYQWTLPENIPAPPVPTDNTMSDIKVELGRWLFHDRRLSVNSSMSCATCHRQDLAFTDARPVPTGATGEIHPRGAMTLVNAGYGSRLTWANHLLDRLENQALTPLFGENPVEMGMGGREEVVVKLLRTDVRYRSLVPSVFPTDEDPYSVLNAVRAIASFVRSIVSFDSAYDRYLAGDPSAMGESAIRGMTLFFSEKTECFHCHGGFNFTDSSTHASSRIESVGFHNNGLYNIGDNGGYPPGNTGLHDMTGKRRDMGRFKAPTLRNISLTAPYMHDGSIESLDAVLDHYQQGGRRIREGPYSGDGSRNPYKSVFVRAFELEETERADLLAFLDALTDRSVLTNPRFSNPFTPSSTQ
jgi:cytochrome c peroxidase